MRYLKADGEDGGGDAITCRTRVQLIPVVYMVRGAPQEIDAIIGKADEWRGELLSRLRAVVLDAGPAVVEEVKWKKPSRPEGVPLWSLDGIVCIGEMLKNAVRLTFPKGAHIKDSESLFNARLDSKSVRAIGFREGEKVPEAALRRLIVDAADFNVRSARARAGR